MAHTPQPDTGATFEVAATTPDDMLVVRSLDAPPIEPSAWLRMAGSRRVRALERAGRLATTRPVVEHLGPEPRRGSREDRTCDRCRRHVPHDPPGVPRSFWTSTYAARAGVILTVGLCTRCMGAEYGPEFAQLAARPTIGGDA